MVYQKSLFRVYVGTIVSAIMLLFLPFGANASVGITPSVDKITLVKNQKVDHSVMVFREDASQEEVITVSFPTKPPIEMIGDAQFIFPEGETEYLYQYSIQGNDTTGTYSDELSFLFPLDDEVSGPAIQLAVRQIITMTIVESEDDIFTEIDLNNEIPEKIFNYVQYKDISFTMGDVSINDSSEEIKKERLLNISINIKNIDKKNTIVAVPALVQITKDGELLSERKTSFSGEVFAGETGTLSKKVSVPAEDYYTVIVQIGDDTKDATNNPVAKKIFMWTLFGSSAAILISIGLIFRLLMLGKKKRRVMK